MVFMGLTERDLYIIFDALSLYMQNNLFDSESEKEYACNLALNVGSDLIARYKEDLANYKKDILK